jgi:hypothetical protein
MPQLKRGWLVAFGDVGVVEGAGGLDGVVVVGGAGGSA